VGSGLLQQLHKAEEGGEMQMRCQLQNEQHIRRVLPDGLMEMDLRTMIMHQSVAFFIGRRNSGKSHLMRYVIRKRRKDIDMLVVFCPSEGANGFFTKMMAPKKFVHSVYTIEKLVGIVEAMKQDNSLRKVLVFDDMGYLGKGFWNSPTMKELMFTSRHYNIGLMFAVQYVMHIPIDARFNFTHAFVMMDNALDIITRINTTFFSFIRGKDFQPIFETFTRDHLALVSLGGANKHSVGECMRWIRADTNVLPFVIGCPLYRSYYSRWQIEYYVKCHQDAKRARSSARGRDRVH